ncbi:hypothetical protein BASA62_001593 [Batrachochytrium salamandrivorans]|nr:hypothetical protein BASA62_001593 [Batrachochytrium salamandrivorans]
MAPVLAADSKVTAASSLLALDASLAKLLRTFYHSIPTNSDSSRPPLAAVQSAVLSSMSSSSPVTTNSNSILHTASDGSALPIGMHLPITASRSTTTCNQNSQQHGQSGLAPDTESHCPIPSTQSNQSPPSNQLDPQTQPSTTSASPQSHDSATCQWVVLSSAGTEFVCGAQFATTDELSLHLNDTHIGRKVTRNLCLHCRWLACSHSDTPFHKRDHIKSHIKSHLPLKAFSCQVCHKSYKWHHDFNKHQAKTGHASVLPLVKSKSHLSHDSSMGVELEGSVVSSSFPRPTSPLSLIAKPQMNDTLSATSSPKPVHLLTTIPTPPSLASSSSTTKRRRTENDIHHHVVDRHHTKHLRALLPAPNCRTAPTTVYSESINSIYAASVPSNGDGVSVYPKYALSTTSLDYHDCTDYHDYHQQDHHHPDPLVDSTLSTSSTRFLDASTELQIMDFLQSLPVPDTGAHIHPLQIDNSLMAPLSTLPQSQPSMLSISAPPPFYFEYPDALWQTTSNSVGFHRLWEYVSLSINYPRNSRAAAFAQKPLSGQSIRRFTPEPLT